MYAFTGYLGIEGLERRTLLTASTETFTGPSLSDLIAQAERGMDTAPEAINRELLRSACSRALPWLRLPRQRSTR